MRQDILHSVGTNHVSSPHLVRKEIVTGSHGKREWRIFYADSSEIVVPSVILFAPLSINLCDCTCMWRRKGWHREQWVTAFLCAFGEEIRMLRFSKEREWHPLFCHGNKCMTAISKSAFARPSPVASLFALRDGREWDMKMCNGFRICMCVTTWKQKADDARIQSQKEPPLYLMFILFSPSMYPAVRNRHLFLPASMCEPHTGFSALLYALFHPWKKKKYASEWMSQRRV